MHIHTYDICEYICIWMRREWAHWAVVDPLSLPFQGGWNFGSEAPPPSLSHQLLNGPLTYVSDRTNWFSIHPSIHPLPLPLPLPLDDVCMVCMYMYVHICMYNKEKQLAAPPPMCCACFSSLIASLHKVKKEKEIKKIVAREVSPTNFLLCFPLLCFQTKGRPPLTWPSGALSFSPTY